MVTTERKLTSKQMAFAKQYAVTNNAYQSAIEAGYSENTASVHSHKWLDDVRVMQAIASHKVALAKSEQSINVTPQWITSRLAIEATDADTASARVAALRTLADIHGMMSGSQQQLPDALTALVAGIREGHALASKPRSASSLSTVSRSIPQPAIESSYSVSDE